MVPQDRKACEYLRIEFGTNLQGLIAQCTKKYRYHIHYKTLVGGERDFGILAPNKNKSFISVFLKLSNFKMCGVPGILGVGVHTS